MINKTVHLILFCCIVFSASYSFQNDHYCGNICGDVDGADGINILDIVFLINYKYKDGPAPEPLFTGDADGSRVINILDVVYLVNYKYKLGPEPICPPMIEIIGLDPGESFVYGRTEVSESSSYKVVLYAKTDRWYIQPSVAAPYTNILSDGSWSNSTYPWDRMLALLVDPAGYTPEAIRDYHPSLDQGVICWDEYPEHSIKYIYWMDYRWQIKNIYFDPGPNHFSDNLANVEIDDLNRLNLRIDYRDGLWYCAEVVLDHSLGYGTYKFKLDSRVDNMDYNAILGGFIYEGLDQEFDIEFSQRLVTDPYDAQYVAQPWYIPGNIETFHMSSNSQTSHSFEWRPGYIVFNSWNGHGDSPTMETKIHTWTYTGANIPIPGNEAMIFNLYLHSGDAPVGGIGDEVIITSFEYSN